MEKQSHRFLVVCALAGATVLTGCSGSASPFIATAAVPAIVLPGGGTTLNLAGAIGTTAVLSVSEPGYTGTLTATSSNANVAAVTPPSAIAQAASAAARTAQGMATFTVTSVGAGTATITVSDIGGRSSSVTVVVTTAGGVIQ